MQRIFVIVGCLLLLLLAACSTVSVYEPADNNEGNDQQKFTAFTVDNYGRHVEIKQQPTKVITMGPNCTELFVALGLSDYVVGNCLDNHSLGPLSEYAADYGQIPELNYGSPTLEAVIGSGADFVYAIDWAFGGDVTIETLESYGITVYLSSATSYEEIWQEITDIGHIFGVEEKSTAFIGQEQGRVEAIAQLVPYGEPLRVFVFDNGGGTVKTAGGPNLENLFIETAGGKNIFAELDKSWMDVSYEEVLVRDPDIIVIHDYGTPSAEQKISEMKADSTLSQLKAVQNDCFLVLSLECALPGSRTGYCVESLAKGFYPALFSGE